MYEPPKSPGSGGVGKTMLALALGYRAVEAEVDHSDSLRASARARGLDRKRRELARKAGTITTTTDREMLQSASPSGSISGSVSASPSGFETDTETDGLDGANAHVTGLIRPGAQEADSW